MPFADYKDFADCVNKNKDKDSPEGYCAEIHKTATGRYPSEKEKCGGCKLNMNKQIIFTSAFGQHPLVFEEGRQYITNPSQAPKGVAVKRGERGALYYEIPAKGAGQAQPTRGTKPSGLDIVKQLAKTEPIYRKHPVGSEEPETPHHPELDAGIKKLAGIGLDRDRIAKHYGVNPERVDAVLGKAQPAKAPSAEPKQSPDKEQGTKEPGTSSHEGKIPKPKFKKNQRVFIKHGPSGVSGQWGYIINVETPTTNNEDYVYTVEGDNKQVWSYSDSEITENPTEQELEEP